MRTSQKGFTLAELLIALALLGVIAAFTIPKVLQASGSQEATAKIRETVSTLEQAFYNKKMQNQLSVTAPNNTLYANVASAMNTVSQAATAVDAAGAPFNGLTPAHPCAANALMQQGWLQFANGVVVSGLTGPAFDNLVWSDPTHNQTKNYVVCIDYNGPSNPNMFGQDVFIGNFNQYGGFMNTAPPAETSKSFNWGNTSGTAGTATNPAGSHVLDQSGATIGGCPGGPGCGNGTLGGIVGKMLGG